MSYWGWQVSVVPNIWGMMLVLIDTTDWWFSYLAGGGYGAGRILFSGSIKLLLILLQAKGRQP